MSFGNRRRYFTVLFPIALILLAQFVSADVVLSVADFSVESSSEQYTFVGKGLSTMVAGELRQSRDVKILEREAINAVIEEQNFSLSGMVDEDSQIEIGRMLAADYIVLGKVIDMASAFLISARVVDVETGEVVWSDNLMEKLDNYDYISAFIAEGILTGLDAEVEPETLAKVEQKTEKNPEALVAFSRGVDAYDRGDTKTAKEQLTAAGNIDPDNKTIQFYLSKLDSLTPRYRSEISEYALPYSPASLASVSNVQPYLWVGIPVQAPWIEELPGSEVQPIGDLGVIDRQGTVYIGVSIPAGDSFGIGAGYCGSSQETFIANRVDSTFFSFKGNPSYIFHSFYKNNGGYVSVGFSPSEWLSFGAATMLWWTSNNFAPGESDTQDGVKGNLVHEGFFFSIYPSLIVSPPDSRFLAELNFIYSNQKVYSAAENGEILLSFLPLVADFSFVYGPVFNHLFFGLRSGTDIYYDVHSGYTLRLTPTVEYWPVKFLAIRAGYEYSHFDIDNSFSMGNGFMAGISVNFWKIRMNVNVTYRERPIRNMPVYSIPDFKILVGMEFDTGLLSR